MGWGMLMFLSLAGGRFKSACGMFLVFTQDLCVGAHVFQESLGMQVPIPR